MLGRSARFSHACLQLLCVCCLVECFCVAFVRFRIFTMNPVFQHGPKNSSISNSMTSCRLSVIRNTRTWPLPKETHRIRRERQSLGFSYYTALLLCYSFRILNILYTYYYSRYAALSVLLCVSSFHGLGSWTGEPQSQALSVFRVGLHWLAAKELKCSYHNVSLQYIIWFP